MDEHKKNWFLDIVYSVTGGVFVFFGVLLGIKYSLLVSLAYGVGFFSWCLAFLRILKWFNEKEKNGNKDKLEGNS
ncbi:MAG TPA: hypothetical protein VII00_08285 [bacterium]